MDTIVMGLGITVAVLALSIRMAWMAVHFCEDVTKIADSLETIARCEVLKK